MSQRSRRSPAPSAPSRASQQSLQSPQSEQSPTPSVKTDVETDHVPVDHQDYVYIKFEDPCPNGKSYQFKSFLALDWPCSEPYLIISWDETRGLHFRIRLCLRGHSSNLPFQIYWLPRHIEKVLLSAHDSEENAHLLNFHFSELPQLFGAKGWVQPLSHDEISNVKRIYDMCQLNMSFKVACTPPQLQFLEWIVRRVRVHSIASFEQAPRSWYGGAGSVVIQQQDFTTPALPLSSSEPQPRHRSRSQSSVSNYRKRRFPDSDDDALFSAATRSTLESLPLRYILDFIRDANYIVFHAQDLGPELGPKRRGSLVHSASEVKQRLLDSVSEGAHHSEKRIDDCAAVEKQRIEDRAQADKRRIADLAEVDTERIKAVAAAEMQRIDDLAAVETKRIDDLAAVEIKRINDDYAMVGTQRISNSAPADG